MAFFWDDWSWQTWTVVLACVGAVLIGLAILIAVLVASKKSQKESMHVVQREFLQRKESASAPEMETISALDFDQDCLDKADKYKRAGKTFEDFKKDNFRCTERGIKDWTALPKQCAQTAQGYESNMISYDEFIEQNPDCANLVRPWTLFPSPAARANAIGITKK